MLIAVEEFDPEPETPEPVLPELEAFEEPELLEEPEFPAEPDVFDPDPAVFELEPDPEPEFEFELPEEFEEPNPKLFEEPELEFEPEGEFELEPVVPEEFEGLLEFYGFDELEEFRSLSLIVITISMVFKFPVELKILFR